MRLMLCRGIYLSHSVALLLTTIFLLVPAGNFADSAFKISFTLEPIMDLTSEQVLSGNDNDGTIMIALSWTPVSGAVEVEIYRKGFGFYPEYDDAGGTVPIPPDTSGDNDWEFVVSVPGTESGYIDATTERDFWYYVAFSFDSDGIASPVSNMTSGCLNYILGDVSDGETPCQGNNHVGGEDVSLFGYHYGDYWNDPPFHNCLDIGPTHDGSQFGLPLTDDQIGFADLILVALNYSPGSPSEKSASPLPLNLNTLTMYAPIGMQTGHTFDVAVYMTGDGTVQALSIELDWDIKTAEMITVQPGKLLSAQVQPHIILTPESGVIDVALLGVGNSGIAGEGELVRVKYRTLNAKAPQIALKSAVARDKRNEPVSIEISETDRDMGQGNSDKVVTLHSNVPNPFNPITNIKFNLSTPKHIRLAIYSVDGRCVATLLEEQLPAGHHEATWTGKDDSGHDVASGSYIYRLEAGEYSATRRMMLIR